MRFVRTVVVVALLSASVFAADFKVKVVDPNSSAIGSAQVSLSPVEQSTLVGVLLTSAEGLASFTGIPDGPYRLQVLAQVRNAVTHRTVAGSATLGEFRKTYYAAFEELTALA